MKTISELRQQREELQKAIGAYMHELFLWDAHIEKSRQEGYQKGLSDAWEIARKACLYSSSKDGMDWIDERRDCFGRTDTYDILHMTVSEAKAKYDTWKAKKEQEDEIRVGDVVASPSGIEYIVLHASYNDDGIKTFTVLEVSTGFVLHFKGDFLEKTGKHYDLPWLQGEKQEKQHDGI